jgi:hypothetical protein
VDIPTHVFLLGVIDARMHITLEVLSCYKACYIERRVL